MSDERWGYASSKHAESWTGCCLTQDEAIAEGRATYCCEPFWIQSGHLVPLEAVMPDVDDIIDTMRDRACDEAGEVAEEFPDVSQAAKDELADLLMDWGRKYCEPEFWVADGDSFEVLATGESHEWTTDGCHSNVFCRRCFVSAPAPAPSGGSDGR